MEFVFPVKHPKKPMDLPCALPSKAIILSIFQPIKPDNLIFTQGLNEK